MPSCSICIDELKRPVSLPCGHVFCNDCVYRAVTAVKPYANLHYCPTCRAPYTTVNMDNSVVPDHLRPHVLPHIRRLFLDERTTPPASSNMPSEPQTQFAECSRLSAENKTLRFNCDMWRKRAECHAAATIGLLNLARTARDEALKMKKERDELQAKFQVMKRKRDVDEAFNRFSSPTTSSSTSTSSSSGSITPDYCHPISSRAPSIKPEFGRRIVGPSGTSAIPVAVTSDEQTIACSAWADIAKNIKQEPPAKKQRIAAPRASSSGGASLAKILSPHDVEDDILQPSLSRSTRRTPSPAATV